MTMHIVIRALFSHDRLPLAWVRGLPGKAFTDLDLNSLINQFVITSLSPLNKPFSCFIRIQIITWIVHVWIFCFIIDLFLYFCVGLGIFLLRIIDRLFVGF